jgi:hypothetical protein
MAEIDLDNIEDIVRAKAAIESNTKQGDIETVAKQVRDERLAAETFKEIKTMVKECVNRYNSTASRERVTPLQVSADNLRSFAVETSDGKGSFSINIEGATIKYARGTKNRPFEEWALRANDTDRVKAKLMEFLWEA